MDFVQRLAKFQIFVNLIAASIVLALTIVSFLQSLSPSISDRINAYLTTQNQGQGIDTAGADFINLVFFILIALALSAIFSRILL